MSLAGIRTVDKLDSCQRHAGMTALSEPHDLFEISSLIYSYTPEVEDEIEDEVEDAVGSQPPTPYSSTLSQFSTDSTAGRPLIFARAERMLDSRTLCVTHTISACWLLVIF